MVYKACEIKDENNNVVYKMFPDGIDVWYDYDENGKHIHSRYSNGREYFYDENGNTVTDELHKLLVIKKIIDIKIDMYRKVYKPKYTIEIYGW